MTANTPGRAFRSVNPILVTAVALLMHDDLHAAKFFVFKILIMAIIAVQGFAAWLGYCLLISIGLIFWFMVAYTAFNSIPEMGVMVEDCRPYSFDCDLFMRIFSCDSYSWKQNAQGYCPNQQSGHLHFSPSRVEKISGLKICLFYDFAPVNWQGKIMKVKRKSTKKQGDANMWHLVEAQGRAIAVMLKLFAEKIIYALGVRVWQFALK
jgi:hypothetical protein